MNESAVIAFCFTFRAVNGFSFCFVVTLTFKVRLKSSFRLSRLALSRHRYFHRILHLPYHARLRDPTVLGFRLLQHVFQPF